MTSEYAELLQRATSGDSAAWSELVESCQGLVYSIVRSYRFDDDEAADVFQDVFVRLYQRGGDIRDGTRLVRWLSVTTNRLCIDRVRRAKLGREVHGEVREMPDFVPEPPPTDEATLRDERIRHVQRAMNELSPRCRALLHGLFFDEEQPDYREMARRLGLQIGSVGPIRARCLAHLLENLRRGGFFD